jgi:hypothetical protein
MNQRIIDAIKPETELEKQIISDPEFIEGALYGKPRPGHPEGEVLLHIVEVLKNVDKYHLLNVKTRANLRLITIIHDTFKYKVDRAQPKTGENHHGRIARRFAEKYINDTKILDVIEWHDDAYNAWYKGDRDRKWDKAETRAQDLIKKLYDIKALDLYMNFYQCDNETGDKTQECLEWFKELI